MSKVENFGKYLLLEKLAVGGMAEVYLAKSAGANGLAKLVALKRILPQFTNNPDFISMFKEEAKVAINLNHSNIVSIYDFGIEDSQFYLVMEFVDGRNLRQIINEMKKLNKSFSIDQAVYIIKEAAAGLNHAHRCVDSHSGKPLNITHRDMSPQNIMISFEGETKVIDFGIAKAETEAEATKAGTLKGKFSYMSPEQAEGYPIDPRTDVFALGIILWELLANDRLFTGSNEGAILRKIRDGQVPAIRKINPTVPPELERIVMKALAKDKNVRYQTAANFHKDLNLFLNTQYPDFSTHDFSMFVRECFKVGYAEGKEKLIAYAKIQPPPIEPYPSEVISGTKTTSEPLPLPPIGIAKQNVSWDGLKSASLSKRPMSHDTRAGVSIHSTSNTQLKYKKVKRTSPLKDVIPKIALLGVIAFAGFVGYKNYFLNTKKGPSQKAVSVTKKAPVDKSNETQIDMAATASTRLSVSSEPPGARIFVDGQSTNQFSPAIVTVTVNKPVTITLIKDGFYKYQISKEFNNASSLKAVLTAMPPMGYINVHVANGGTDSIITVDGVRLDSRPPIKNYAIPAGKEIEIKAFNPMNNLEGRTKVRVTPNKIQDVQIILKRIKK